MAKQSSTDFNNDVLPIATIIFFSIALVSQFFGYLNPDNAWLVYVADQVAGGQELYKDVIETNPPLIVYLMLIPAYFSDMVGLADWHSFTFFIFLVTMLSLSLSFRVTKNLWLKVFAVYALVFYSGHNFGQREHLMVLLILPYVFSVIEGYQGKKVNILIAVLAAIGFAIKPYYIILWAFVELFSATDKRRISSIFVLRNFIIGILLVSYVGYLFFIETRYVDEILPYMLQYYSGFNWDINIVIKSVILYFVFFQIPLFVTLIKAKESITKNIVFYSLANIICIVIVLIQQKSWSNHFYPAAVFGILMNVMLIVEMLKSPKGIEKKIIISVSGFILLSTLAVAVSINFAKAANLKNDKIKEQIEILNEHASGHYVYPLSFDLPALFPAILYSDAKYGSRYGHLWQLPGMYANTQLDSIGEVIYLPENIRSYDEVELLADIIADIAHKPPQLIFVTDRKYNTNSIGDFKFDFVRYMSRQKEFDEIFSNYENLMEIDEQIIYKYKSH